LALLVIATSLASPLGAQTVASPTLWLEDWAAALAASAQSGKPVLVDATGTDWAPPARRLEVEVYSQQEFAAAATAKFVLLRLDYPRMAFQAEKVRAQNARLKDLLAIDSLPTTLLVDAKGFVWARSVGAVRGGTQAWLAMADGLVVFQKELMALKTAAEAATGADKLAPLHALFLKADEAGLAWEFSAVPAQIIALDKDNKAGLANRYRVYGQYNRLLADWTLRGADTAITEFTALADKVKDQPDLRQKILMSAGLVHWNARTDEQAAKTVLLEAWRLLPDSTTGRRVRELLTDLP